MQFKCSTSCSGITVVDLQLRKVARENPTVKGWLNDKIEPSRAPEFNPEKVGLHVIEGVLAMSKKNPLLSTIESAAAVVLINDMFNVPEMKKFLEQEERPEVASALKHQINKIEKVKGTKKKDQ